jgi:hypothetical protein
MRKILLASTAIASTFAIASAHAEVSISGGATMSYQSVSDDMTRTAVSDETLGFADNTITVSFSAVTDSGLSLAYSTNMYSSTSQNASISGDFGSIAMSGTAHAAESFDVTSPTMKGGHGDVQGTVKGSISSGAGVAVTADVRENEADMSHLTGANIAYYSPSINGFSFGASIGSIAATDDVTSFGAKYSADMGGVSYSVGYAASEGAANVSANHMGVSVTAGDITVGLATADNETSTSSKEEVTSYGVTYVMSDALSLNAGHVNSENTLASKEMTMTSVGLSYTIASGLAAHIANNSFDYKESSATVNDGSIMSVMLTLSF